MGIKKSLINRFVYDSDRINQLVVLWSLWYVIMM